MASQALLHEAAISSKQILCTKDTHKASILALSNLGSRVLTASSDGHLVAWHTPLSGGTY